MMSSYKNKTVMALQVQMSFLLTTSSCSCISLQSFLNGEGKTVHSGLKEYFAAGAEARGPKAATHISAAVLL